MQEFFTRFIYWFTTIDWKQVKLTIWYLVNFFGGIAVILFLITMILIMMKTNIDILIAEDKAEELANEKNKKSKKRT